MKSRIFFLCLLVGLSGAVLCPAAGTGAGAVHLSLYALDSRDMPIQNLGKRDFQLEIDGTPVEIEEAQNDVSRDVLLVFDRLSLEKKNLENVLLMKRIEGVLASRVSIGVFLGGESVEELQAPTLDPDLFAAALQAVAKAEYFGEKYRGMKRTLTRSVSSAQTYQTGAFKSPAGTASNGVSTGLGVEDAFGSLQAKQYVDQVDQLRDREYARILQELLNLEMLIRGCGGRPGRHDIVWIGEDFFAYPGLDVYSALWQNFQSFSTTGALKMPELWAGEKNLKQEFETVGALAQGMGVRLHLVDIADRSRYMTDRVNRGRPGSGLDRYQEGDPRNMVMNQTGAQAQDLAWGGKILAGGSGGLYFYGSRDPAPFFEKLQALFRGSYLLSFDMPGAVLDGALHEVMFSTNVPGAQLGAPARFAAAHPLSRLSDLATAEALLHLGENDLGFSIESGDSEKQEDGRMIQSFRMILPVNSFRFDIKDGVGTAHLAIGVAMRIAGRQPDAPKVFELPVNVDADRLQKARKIATSFRLLIDGELEEIAVAVLDERSGNSGSMTLKPGKSSAGK